MKFVLQPKDSSICGHCCLAMVTGVSIKTIIKLIGHSRATRTIELYKVLKKLGFKSDKKLTRRKSGIEFPKTCILKITYKWRKNTGHWVFYNKGVVYCPGGSINHWTDYDRMSSVYGKITSYLQINKLNKV